MTPANDCNISEPCFSHQQSGVLVPDGVPRGERRPQGTRCVPGVTEQPSVVASITPSLSHRTASSLKTEIKPFDSVDSAFTRCLHHEETVRDTRPLPGGICCPATGSVMGSLFSACLAAESFLAQGHTLWGHRPPPLTDCGKGTEAYLSPVQHNAGRPSYF